MAEDRLAVTNVVAALGEAKDSGAALRIARVAEQITGIQNSARKVSSGIHTTSDTISRMDAVQARMNEVLEEQARMASALAS